MLLVIFLQTKSPVFRLPLTENANVRVQFLHQGWSIGSNPGLVFPGEAPLFCFRSRKHLTFPVAVVVPYDCKVHVRDGVKSEFWAKLDSWT